jgi:hypothetical protein
MKKYKLPKMKQGGVAKDTHKTKDGKTAKKGLYYYMNRKKKKGTSNPKSKSTVLDKSYANMKAGFPKMRNGGVASDPPKKNKSLQLSGLAIPINEKELKGIVGNVGLKKDINKNFYTNVSLDGMYGEINENNTPINFLNFKTKGGVGYKNTDTGIKTELGIEKKLDNINDPTLYTNFNIDKEKYNIGINANLPFNENQIKPIIMGNASFRPNKKTNITLEGGYDFNTNQPNFKAGVTRKFRNGGVAGDPPKKPKRIKIEKSNWEGKGLSHPTTTQGYNQLMTKAYEGLKKDEQYQVKCSGNEQCAGQNNLLLKNMKNSLSNELGYKTEYKRKRRDAWNIKKHYLIKKCFLKKVYLLL